MAKVNETLDTASWTATNAQTVLDELIARGDLTVPNQTVPVDRLSDAELDTQLNERLDEVANRATATGKTLQHYSFGSNEIYREVTP